MPDEVQTLREILPMLRPRSAEPTLFSQTVFYLLWLGLATLGILYFLRRFRLLRKRRREFEDLGVEQGLSKDQIQLLLRISRKDRMKNPMRLLSSARFFDRHVGKYAAELASSDLDHPLLDDIGDVRVQLGFDALPPAQSLVSTRQLKKGQTLLVWQEADVVEGFSPWLVIERDEAAIGVVPLLKNDHSYFRDLNIGDELSVRFWRQGDTEYRFDTEVVADEPNSHSYYLAHSNQVKRQQQRDYFRVDVSFELVMYGLPEEEPDSGAGAALSGSIEAAAIDSAAVDLLDSEEEEAITLDEGGEQTPPEETLNLATAPRMAGLVGSISGGGMGLLIAGSPEPGFPRWLVDPAFKGPFPLAGVTCLVVGEQPQGQKTLIKLKFEDLPANAESQIVRGVYQHQLVAAGVELDGERGPVSH